jgi:hypothetical protein
MHFEYQSSHTIPGGVFNFNFIDSSEGETAANPGDTLSVAISAHTPAFQGDNANTSIDMHFRSGPLNDTTVTALLNAVSINEDNGMIDLTSFLGPAFTGGSSDFNIRAQSDIPEPVSIALLGVGLAGLGVIRRRRKAT